MIQNRNNINPESSVEKAIHFLYLATIIASLSINILDIFRLIEVSESFILYTNVPAIFIVMISFLLKMTNLISLKNSFSIVAITILINSMVSVYQSRLLEDLVISLLRESIFIAFLISLCAFVVSKWFTHIITAIYCIFIFSVYLITKDAYILENLPILILIFISYSVFINYLVYVLNSTLTQLNMKNLIIKEQLEEIKTQNEELLQLNEELYVQREMLEENNEKLNKKNIELTLSKNELVKLNDTKNKLFSVIGHDIKNPMHVILGYSRLLIDRFQKLNDQKKITYIEAIDSNISKLYNLLENLLIWSKTQQDNIICKPEDIDLNLLITESVQLFDDAIKNKKIKVVFSTDANITAYADKNMIHLVIRNLLNNAFKYSNSNGIVTITSSYGNSNVLVHISDNGIGIPGELSSDIFGLHDHKSRPGTQGEKGTGFGLAICKEYIEKNKGKIWFNSIEGEETTFSFSLPRGK